MNYIRLCLEDKRWLAALEAEVRASLRVVDRLVDSLAETDPFRRGWDVGRLPYQVLLDLAGRVRGGEITPQDAAPVLASARQTRPDYEVPTDLRIAFDRLLWAVLGIAYDRSVVDRADPLPGF